MASVVVIFGVDFTGTHIPKCNSQVVAYIAIELLPSTILYGVLLISNNPAK